MFLKNEILHLRYYEPSDLDFLMTIRPNPENYNFFGEFEPYSQEMQKAWWEKYTRTSTEFNYVVALNEGNRPIGTVSLINIDYRNKNCEFSRFFIDKKAKISNAGSQVEKLILDYSFLHLNLHKLWCKVIEDNKKAVTFYQRYGFKKDGILRQELFKNGEYKNVIIMSILQEEYLNKFR